MRICYAKMGRSVLLDPKKYGPVGGDNEALALLLQLAERHPDVEWVVAGKHSGDPGNLPANITVPTLPKDKVESHNLIRDLYEDCDGVVMWIGQHGTTNIPIEKVKPNTGITSPYEFARNYCAPIIDGINRWQDADPSRDVTWVLADPRNTLKTRDLKWPARNPILAQYDFSKVQKHFRFGDPTPPQDHGFGGVFEDRHWIDVPQRYCHAGIELSGVPRWEDSVLPTFEQRVPFGIIVNETRSYVTQSRQETVGGWVLPILHEREDAFFHGKWSDKTKEELGINPEPVHYTVFPDVMASARTTFTTPASGSGWATAKPYECFALGTVCFFHPGYDDQGHVILTRDQLDAVDPQLWQTEHHLADWLRPRTPEELRARVDQVAADEGLYDWLRDAQRYVLAQARAKNKCITMIEERVGLAQ